MSKDQTGGLDGTNDVASTFQAHAPDQSTSPKTEAEQPSDADIDHQYSKDFLGG